MLLAFKLRNFRSFRDEYVLNLTHGGRRLSEGMPHPDVMPAVAVFGGNASGKSNLLRGLETMFGMIQNSASRPGPLPYEPFLLGAHEPGPTLFEVTVRLDGIRYDYGFEYTGKAVVAEWLYSNPRGRTRVLFERGLNEKSWYFGDSLPGATQAIADATRVDALFLSTTRLLKHQVLSALQEQLGGLVFFLNAENLALLVLQRTLESLKDDPIRAGRVARFLSDSDLGIESLTVEQAAWPPNVEEGLRRFHETITPDASPEEIQTQVALARLRPSLKHRSAGGNSVPLPFAWESVGTKNLLALLGPVLDRLSTGGVLVVDELDTSLHPRLVSTLVKQFTTVDKNPRQAQLILSTHDVTVMMNIGGYGAIDSDQIWLIEKDDNDGSSRLYSVWDFRKPHKGEVLSRNYLLGRYGGLPRIHDTNYPTIIWPDVEADDAHHQD